MMTNNDYYFFVNWEDAQKNTYRVGVLARIDNVYFLKTIAQNPDNSRDAYSHGYTGMPAFRPGEIYKSVNGLFDFFVNRVYRTGPVSQFDYMEALKKTKGITFTDSFSLEEIPESRIEECKKLLLQLEEIKEDDMEKGPEKEN